MDQNRRLPVTGTIHQGRARGLYDEQLQRKQQEKALAKGGWPGLGPAPFTLKAPVLGEPTGKVD